MSVLVSKLILFSCFSQRSSRSHGNFEKEVERKFKKLFSLWKSEANFFRNNFIELDVIHISVKRRSQRFDGNTKNGKTNTFAHFLDKYVCPLCKYTELEANIR